MNEFSTVASIVMLNVFAIGLVWIFVPAHFILNILFSIILSSIASVVIFCLIRLFEGNENKQYETAI